jgi:hypothetical protein
VSREEIIERERRWAIPAALLSIGAVVLFAASLVMLASSYSAEGNAELLRKVNDDSGTLVFAYVIRALGSAMLAVPLLYLFQAAQARSPGMRRQFIGLCIAGPLFLAGFSLCTGLSLKDAAPDFVAVAKPMHALGNTDHADNVAQDVISDSSLRQFVAGFYIAGALSFAFALAYSCFNAMRVGLLTRFWGSLGAALGVASIIFFQYTLLWIAYLGLLIGGWTPRGRPPAWGAGEAVPWPTPGEKAAESLQGEQRQEGNTDPEPDGEGVGATEADSGKTGEAGDESAPSGPRRKRKRRN